jgi:predicted nucleic acid-binding protein
LSEPPVVLDTNVLVAALVGSDDLHAQCAPYVEALPRPLLVSVLALAEVAYLLQKHVGPEAELELVRLIADGDILPIYDPSNWADIHELATRYVDQELGMVDSSLFICAEAVSSTRIATMDGVHRSVVTKRSSYFMIEP